jgi:hypothetical protein
MRPVLDPRLFPGLPKILWFDNGDGGDGDGGDGDSGPGAATGSNSAGPGGTATAVGTSGAPAGTGAPGGSAANSAAAAAAGGSTSSDGSAPGPSGGPSGVSDGVASSVSFGGQGASNAGAGPSASGSGAPGGATAPGASTGGGVSTAAVGHSGVTGGGGGTASGGASSGAVQGMNPSVVTALIRAGLMSVPPGVLTGQPAVNPLQHPDTKFSLRASPDVVAPGLNSGLTGLAQQVFGTPGPNNPSLVGKVTAQTGPTMGFPAYEGASPGLGGFGGHAASPGPTQGSPSVIGPAGPNGPSAFASNVDTSPGPTAAPTADENSLAQAAKTAQAQTNATTTAPSSPPGGGLLGLVMNLVMGSAGPQLSQLAQNTPAYNRTLRQSMPNAPPESEFWNAPEWQDWMMDPQNAPPPPPTQPVNPSQLVS